jgi:hypothetical protein
VRPHSRKERLLASSCLSVHPHVISAGFYHWTDIIKILYLAFQKKSVEKIQFWFKSGKIWPFTRIRNYVALLPWIKLPYRISLRVKEYQAVGTDEEVKTSSESAKMFRSTYTAYLVTFPEAVKIGASVTSDLDSVACWFHSLGQQLSCDFISFSRLMPEK